MGSWWEAEYLSFLSVVLAKLYYWKESLFIYRGCGKKDWCVVNTSHNLFNHNPNNSRQQWTLSMSYNGEE